MGASGCTCSAGFSSTTGASTATGATAASTAAATGIPQPPQNTAPSGSCFPQFLQTTVLFSGITGASGCACSAAFSSTSTGATAASTATATGVPQLPQNIAPSGSCFPQFLQTTVLFSGITGASGCACSTGFSSTTGASAATGATAASTAAATGVPQFPQKVAPSGSCFPQFLQTTVLFSGITGASGCACSTGFSSTTGASAATGATAASTAAATGVPQPPQNIAPSGSGFPQFLQNIVIPLLSNRQFYGKTSEAITNCLFFTYYSIIAEKSQQICTIPIISYYVRLY